MKKWGRLVIIGVVGVLWLLPLTMTLAQEATPEAIPTPDPIESSGPLHNAESIDEILTRARSDLELLADALAVTRPEIWSGSSDIEDPQLPALLRIDLEVLAGMLLSFESRPDTWFGVVPSSPYYVARDIRHDLELLADAVLDPETSRPNGWVGGPAIFRCDRAVQAWVEFLQSNAVFELTADPAAPDFCGQLLVEVMLFVEPNYLEPSPVNGILTDTGLISRATIRGNFAVAFFDRYVRERVGVVPDGTPIQPLGRSYAQYSTMMLIRGDGFTVFVDYGFTTVSDDEFEALPNIDDLEVDVECGVDWCNVMG